ncbi:MAG: nucleoside triphosphate pyrophosphohydrolase [Firmicutes bacterium]|nr:nucleoside triphosphate pyrophosphohydrolase [Bacillota bacterium]
MNKIIIVGLGPGDYEDLTIKALNILKSAKCLVLRTEKHPLVDDLKLEGLSFHSCDDIYDSSDNFEEVYEKISDRIINMAKENDEVVYAVPGHPFVAEKSVQLIIGKSKGIAELQIVSAMSFIDAVSASLRIDISKGLKIIDGLRLGEQNPDMDCGNIITQVYSKIIASEIKLKLMDYYNDDQSICVLRVADGIEKLQWIKLYELDKIEWVDYLTSIYIPKVVDNKKFNTIDDLVSIMKILRSDSGCPWDRRQDHQTLKPCLLEECYEALEAIEEEDIESMIEELGDVLLQIIFHAQIGKENGEFDINDIVTGLVNKLVTRHPHVFGETEASSESGALENWEASKRKEKKVKCYFDTLESIPKIMPSLTRSYKIQQKAALAGFDWDSVDGAMGKVDEELLELKEVYKSTKFDKIEEEIGDLLFAVVNVARFLNIQPELALRGTIEKFLYRFKFMEELSLSLGKNLDIMTLHEMDLLWDKAKTQKFTKNDKK